MDDPRPTVGIVGAGQLARMCWQAAIGLDVRLRVLAARPDDAAALVLPEAAVEIGDARDPDALARFAARCDVVTLDHELVDGPTLAALTAAGCAVRPDAAALRYAQDKAYQRRAFADAGLPVPAFASADGPDDVRRFAADHGWPIVLKRPRGGYDGRAVWLVDGPADLAAAWADAHADDTLVGGEVRVRSSASEPVGGEVRVRAGASEPVGGEVRVRSSASEPVGGEVLVEQGVAIDRELAVLLARRPGGGNVVAPVVETVQRDGMLRELVVPARVPAVVQRAAADLAGRIVDLVGVVGVCAIELFWTGSDLLINEIATRPHNSGHWTIDGAATSQFENHLRAVLDLPLGSMRATAAGICSVNVVGHADDRWPQTRLRAALDSCDVHVHLYGKMPRPGRKLGHVTAAADDVASARQRAHDAARSLMDGP